MTADPIYRDAPPAASQRVRALHAWIAIYPDGSEGIMSADMTFDGQRRHMPLLSSQRATAESLRPIAERVRDEALRQAHRDIRIELRRFAVSGAIEAAVGVSWEGHA
jgi:hypothetical protein